MSRKGLFAIAAVGVLGISALVVGKSFAQVAVRAAVDPYAPQTTVVSTHTTTLVARPPVRDPFRPPTRSAFAP
jgi:hypothetical protein